MGTSFEDARARGIVWTRVYFDYIWAFLMRAPLSTDVPVLLLNQPNITWGGGEFESEDQSSRSVRNTRNRRLLWSVRTCSVFGMNRNLKYSVHSSPDIRMNGILFCSCRKQNRSEKSIITVCYVYSSRTVRTDPQIQM